MTGPNLLQETVLEALRDSVVDLSQVEFCPACRGRLAGYLFDLWAASLLQSGDAPMFHLCADCNIKLTAFVGTQIMKQSLRAPQMGMTFFQSLFNPGRKP
jgi:hypothetical protein